ncbi:hypothetical protein ACFQL7_26565 [Halocatena marina]|uniref:Uncharacterized protein n=1 Tax=Halocatena marina TaxID=2934937 RepID=A0ABD5YUK7_9EURY
MSVLFVLGSLPVVTTGASLMALSEALTTVVTGENRGGPTSERERVSLFVSSFRESLVRGLPYTTAILVVALVTSVYGVAFVSAQTPTLFLGSLIGLYAVVIVPVWLLRAASVTVRSPATPGFRASMKEGISIALERPYFSVLQLTIVGLLGLLSTFFPALAVVFAPGAITVLEVISYEELAGRGATDIATAYRGVDA